MSILYKLDHSGVVSFEIDQDKKRIIIEDGCDRWYDVKLTKLEFGEMIKELHELYNQME